MGSADRIVIEHSLYVLVLFALPMVAHLLGWKPFSHFVMAAVAFGIVTIVSFTLMKSVTISYVDPARSGFQDVNYYIITSIGTHSAVLIGVMTILAFMTWVQDRFNAMRYPKTTRALFWMMHIALVTSIMPTHLFRIFISTPRKYGEYATYLETIGTISSFASLVFWLALIVLTLWSGLKAWRVQS